MILAILELCDRFGYGRVSQLAHQIEQIWRNPEAVEYFKRIREGHLTLLKDGMP